MSKARMLRAVKELDVETVRALLAADPGLLRVTDRRGFNLLHLACCVPCTDLGIAESQAAKMVTLLLDDGLDVESKLPPEQDRCTALFFAVARGRNATLIKLLLKRGAKVQNAPGGGLFAAAWYDDVNHLDLLIKAGAKVDVVVGMTPLLAAWTWKKFQAARFLAKRGANVNTVDPKSGRTALHYGVEKEFDPAQVAWLVDHGASPDIKDKHGVSARNAHRGSATNVGSTRLIKVRLNALFRRTSHARPMASGACLSLIPSSRRCTANEIDSSRAPS